MVVVDQDYIIDIDSFNYTAKRNTHQKEKIVDKITGEEKEVDRYKTVGYYSSLGAAIKGIINDMTVRKFTKNVLTLEEALKVIIENNKKFTKLMEKVIEV